MEASDVSVESRASDLNFFSGMCSVVWWVGAQYFLSEDTKTKGQRSHPLWVGVSGEVGCMLLVHF